MPIANGGETAMLCYGLSFTSLPNVKYSSYSTKAGWVLMYIMWYNTKGP